MIVNIIVENNPRPQYTRHGYIVPWIPSHYHACFFKALFMALDGSMVSLGIKAWCSSLEIHSQGPKTCTYFKNPFRKST